MLSVTSNSRKTSSHPTKTTQSYQPTTVPPRPLDGRAESGIGQKPGKGHYLQQPAGATLPPFVVFVCLLHPEHPSALALLRLWQGPVGVAYDAVAYALVVALDAELLQNRLALV